MDRLLLLLQGTCKDVSSSGVFFLTLGISRVNVKNINPVGKEAERERTTLH